MMMMKMMRTPLSPCLCLFSSPPRPPGPPLGREEGPGGAVAGFAVGLAELPHPPFFQAGRPTGMRRCRSWQYHRMVPQQSTSRIAQHCCSRFYPLAPNCLAQIVSTSRFGRFRFTPLGSLLNTCSFQFTIFLLTKCFSFYRFNKCS